MRQLSAKESAFLEGIRQHPEALPAIAALLTVRTVKDLDRLEETAKTADPVTARILTDAVRDLRKPGALPIAE